MSFRSLFDDLRRKRELTSSSRHVSLHSFLTRLLLVHGHWSYVRVAEMHANFFYKNIIWTGTLFWFCIFNEWEATYLFEYTFILLYNLIFT